MRLLYTMMKYMQKTDSNQELTMVINLFGNYSENVEI